MGASDLPLGVRQRIEQRWSAQIKRHQQERDLKDKATTADDVETDGELRLIDVADWPRKPRES